MPTYEYRCPKGHDFELFQKMSDEPRASCPQCGAESERLLSGGAGFLFKGGGFLCHRLPQRLLQEGCIR